MFIEGLISALNTELKPAEESKMVEKPATERTTLLSATAAPIPKETDAETLQKTLASEQDYIAKMTAICYFVQTTAHAKDSISYRLLLSLGQGQPLQNAFTEYRSTTGKITDWHQHLLAIWFRWIQDDIRKHKADTERRGHPREAALRSLEGVSVAEKACLVLYKAGPCAHFKIHDHVFERG